MPALALALLLIAAIGHATWNYFAKGARNDLAFNFAIVACSSISYLPLAAGVILIGRPSIPPEALLFIGVTALFHITYYVLLTQGYKSGDLSLVYPLARGTGPMLAVVGAVIIYGERPSPLALVGAAMVVGGILVMSWVPRLGRSSELVRSIAFALATGACTAAYTLWDKRGVELLIPVLYGYGIEVARMCVLAPLVLSTGARRSAVVSAFRQQTRAILAIGLLSPGAYMLVLAALTLAPVSYVAPAREISILFGALIGLRLLRESDPRRRLLGATAIVAGIFALALG